MTTSTSASAQAAARLDTLPAPMNVPASGLTRSWSMRSTTVAPAASARPASSSSDCSASMRRTAPLISPTSAARSESVRFASRDAAAPTPGLLSAISQYRTIRANGGEAHTSAQGAGAATCAAAAADRRRARGQDEASVETPQAQDEGRRVRDERRSETDRRSDADVEGVEPFLFREDAPPADLGSHAHRSSAADVDATAQIQHWIGHRLGEADAGAAGFRFCIGQAEQDLPEGKYVGAYRGGPHLQPPGERVDAGVRLDGDARKGLGLALVRPTHIADDRHDVGHMTRHVEVPTLAEV